VSWDFHVFFLVKAGVIPFDCIPLKAAGQMIQASAFLTYNHRSWGSIMALLEVILIDSGKRLLTTHRIG
jgi:hypothetical protein